jgi:riboflavin synthase
MFTGLIEDIGTVHEIEVGEKENRYIIEFNKIVSEELVIGESISVNGACLTIVTLSGNLFTFDASHETLARTNLSGLLPGVRVNLERALKADGRFGGHIVTGHIDGVGEVSDIKNIGKSIEYSFSVGNNLAKYIIAKGSIAVDGISLTVNDVNKDIFSVNIIPHTQVETVIGDLKISSIVNIECDIIGKYVEKLTRPEYTQDS